MKQKVSQIVLVSIIESFKVVKSIEFQCFVDLLISRMEWKSDVQCCIPIG